MPIPDTDKETDKEKKNRKPYQRFVIPAFLLLILAGSCIIQRTGCSYTVQMTYTYAVFFIVLFGGIWHYRRQRKKEAAARCHLIEQESYKIQAILEGVKRNCICLTLPEDTPCEKPLPAGVTKYGGQPDLPTDYEWPRDNTGRPLSLLLQVDCTEIASYDKEHLFPATGHLYFFYELSAMEWDNKNRVAQVLYNDIPSQELHPVAYPDDLPETCRIAEHPLHLSAHESIPRLDDLCQIETDCYQMDSHAYEKAADRMNLLYFPGGTISSMSGYADTIQYSMLSDPEEDILLMQLFSIYEYTGITPLLFHDYGNLYFYITRRQLAERDFSQVRFELQSY